MYGKGTSEVMQNAQFILKGLNRLCHTCTSAPMPIQNIVFCGILPIYLSLQLQKALAFPVKLNVLLIDILSNCLNHQEGTQNCNVIVMAWELLTGIV